MSENKPEFGEGEYSVRGSFPQEAVPFMNQIAGEMGFTFQRIVGPGGHYFNEHYIPNTSLLPLIIGRVKDGYEYVQITTSPGEGLGNYWQELRRLIPLEKVVSQNYLDMLTLKR